MNIQNVVIANDKVVNANTVYSEEVAIRKENGIFLLSKITTESTGRTFIEVTDSLKTFWSPLPDFDLDINGNTEYCVDLNTNASFIRQGVTLVGAGTFKTNFSN